MHRGKTAAVSIVFLAIVSGYAYQTAPPPFTVWLPYVVGGCMNGAAAEVQQYLATSPRQQRTVMHCNPALVAAAQVRAQSLASRGYWAHCEPGGLCANQVARQAGCALPAHYGDGNSIESLVAGPDKVRTAMDELSKSQAHANHLYALLDFFRDQDQIGVAVLHAPGSQWGYYYVILIARCE